MDKKIGFDIEFELINKNTNKPFIVRNIKEIKSRCLSIGLDGSKKCYEVRSHRTMSIIFAYHEIINLIAEFAAKYNKRYSFDSITHPLGAHFHLFIPNIKNHSNQYTENVMDIVRPYYEKYSIYNINKRRNSFYGTLDNAVRINYKYSTLEVRFMPSSYAMKNERNFVDTLITMSQIYNQVLNIPLCA